MTLRDVLRRLPVVRAIEAAAYQRGMVDGSTATAATLAKDLATMRGTIFMDGFFEGRASVASTPLEDDEPLPLRQH